MSNKLLHSFAVLGVSLLSTLPKGDVYQTPVKGTLCVFSALKRCPRNPTLENVPS